VLFGAGAAGKRSARNNNFGQVWNISALHVYADQNDTSYQRRAIIPKGKAQHMEVNNGKSLAQRDHNYRRLLTLLQGSQVA
jgi:hypothetical protein